VCGKKFKNFETEKWGEEANWGGIKDIRIVKVGIPNSLDIEHHATFTYDKWYRLRDFRHPSNNNYP